MSCAKHARRRFGSRDGGRRWFDELLADRAHRVERGHGVLDDEADVGPSDGAVLAFGKTDELAAEKADGARGAGAAAGQTEDRAGEDALARTRLADERMDAPAANGEVHAVQYVDGVERDAKAAHVKKPGGGEGLCRHVGHVRHVLKVRDVRSPESSGRIPDGRPAREVVRNPMPEDAGIT